MSFGFGRSALRPNADSLAGCVLPHTKSVVSARRTALRSLGSILFHGCTLLLCNWAEPSVDTTTPKAYYDYVFTFIESPAFERVREVYLDDDEFGELQQFMMGNPEAGKIVRGSGGVRKLRWRRAGGGKRGGLRVIYFVRRQPDEFWMLALYTKTKQENAPARTLRQLKEAFEE